MRRNVIETAVGAVVLVVAGGFLAFASQDVGLGGDGYRVNARFAQIDGLQIGSDVRISGVRVGRVAAHELDPQTFFADVALSLDSDIRLPKDTSATIMSESLLGGKYVSLEPGGDPDVIPDGGRIEFADSSPSLEQMLRQAIFSFQNSNAGGGDGAP